MATKPRHLKTPMQLWIADNRKRLALTPNDLATLTGVTEATARSWESRGQPSEDAIAALERRFGEPRPPAEKAGGTDVERLAAAIERQAEAIDSLVAEIRVGALAVLSSQNGTQKLLADLVDAAHAGRLDELVRTLREGTRPPSADDLEGRR